MIQINQNIKKLDETMFQFRLGEISESEIDKSLDAVEQSIKDIRLIQPQLNALTLNESENFPKFLSIGKLQIQESVRANIVESNFEQFEAPKVYDFPIAKTLYGSDELSEILMRQALMRIVSVIPLHKLEIVLIDPLSLGKSFAFMRRLLDNDFVYQQKVLTEREECHQALKHIYEYLKTNLQFNLAGYKDWSEYNKKNPNSTLPLKVLFIYGLEDLNDEGLRYLEKIIEFGSSNGVMSFVVSKNTNTKIQNILEKFAQKFADLDFEPKSLEIKSTYENFPSDEELWSFTKKVNCFYDKRRQIKNEITAFWDESEFWTKTSADGIKVPIGWDSNRKEVMFEIGSDSSQHHTLVGGRSGSGKSNFLNVLIENMVYFYSPNELRLYLLDYKEGVEFNVYANPPLAHAELVATQSDVVYGMTFLEWVVKEKDRRAEVFKSVGVKDIKSYRNQGNIMPRMVIVIDEFQVLFTGSGKQSDKINSLLMELLKKGRSYGIHLVFSTQTFRGGSIDNALKSQIGNRVALAMDAEDSQTILGDYEAATLKGSPEGILNASGGFREAHQKMIVPYASPEDIALLIQRANKKAQELGMEIPHKIYNGDAPILMPDVSHQDFILSLGVGLDYAQTPFDLRFTKDIGSNLLIVSNDLEAKSNLLRVIAKNLSNMECLKKIYYFNTDKQIQNVGFSPTHNSSDMFDENLSENSFVIIDSLDTSAELQNKRAGLPKMMEFLRMAKEQNQFVILCVNNYKKMLANYDIKDLFEFFDYRLVYQSNNTNMESATNATQMGEKVSPLHKNNARFVKLSADEQIDFRPYVV